MDERNDKSPPEVVREVIQRARDIIYQGEAEGFQAVHILRGRSKNREFMRDNNLTQSDVADMLTRLTLDNYDTTAKKEGAPDAYVFGINYYGLEVYLKFSFRDTMIMIDVISIHDPDRAFRFPYREGRGGTQ